MKKFVKGAWIAAGCFLIAGILLGAIGLIAARYTDEKYGREGIRAVGHAWKMVRKWDLRLAHGGGRRGLFFAYDDVDFDENHDIFYDSFTDDSLRGENVRNLDLKIGGGTLLIQQGSGMSFQKEGAAETQYYIEGDTFYIRQECPIGSDKADLTLTLPEDILLKEVQISMGAGQIITTGLLEASEVEVDMSAGEITMEEVKADSFSADVATGGILVKKLDAEKCDTNVSMGGITLQNSLVTGDFNATTSMGEISIYLRDSYENHNYDISCGVGDVEMITERGEKRGFSGIGGSTELIGKNTTGNSLYNLSCSMGNIYMEFSGEQKM